MSLIDRIKKLEEVISTTNDQTPKFVIIVAMKANDDRDFSTMVSLRTSGTSQDDIVVYRMPEEDEDAFIERAKQAVTPQLGANCNAALLFAEYRQTEQAG